MPGSEASRHIEDRASYIFSSMEEGIEERWLTIIDFKSGVESRLEELDSGARATCTCESGCTCIFKVRRIYGPCGRELEAACNSNLEERSRKSFSDLCESSDSERRLSPPHTRPQAS